MHQMGPWYQGWAVVLVVVMCFMAALAEDELPKFGDKRAVRPGAATSVGTEDDGAPEAQVDGHHRLRRQLLDGWTPLRDTLSALENVDDMLRTTVPNVDRLQCLERFMCELSTGSLMRGITEFINPTTPIPLLPLPQPIAQFPTFQGQNPAFQQGFQQFQQHPTQGQLSQFPQFQQSPQQGFPPVHSQSFPQQGFPPHNPAFQHHIDPNQVQQTFDPTFQQGGFVSNPEFQQFPIAHHSQQVPAQHFSQFRESSTNDNNVRREGETRPIRRPLHKNKPQRSGIMGFLDGFLSGRKKRSTAQTEGWLTINKAEENKINDSRNLSRKKRGLLDSLLNTFNAFTPDMMLRLLDQYMVGQQNSLYPYTHAAVMGYTGSSQRCEQRYPECPTNPDEMIHVFNNIRRYYPEGLPFADQLPWPLRDLFK